MVQQRISAKISTKLEEVAEILPPGPSNQELNLGQAKAVAIHNWLNSKICGKAC
jgi:hypothetical protein